jgi:hypothetical protein
VKLGYPWSTLTKEPNRDRYTQTLPYGSAGVTIQAVPNKAWDLINKTTEALLRGLPADRSEPGDDSEQAEAACDMADRFLTQDASEQGTNDAVLFGDRVERALTCASSYLECWTDPTGGGYVPLQIPAHPQAESPRSPLIGPDGMPTASPVCATSPKSDPTASRPSSRSSPTTRPKPRRSGSPSSGPRSGSASTSASTPKPRPSRGREGDHPRLLHAGPREEAVAVDRADGAGRLSALCDWTPPRYLALLPNVPARPVEAHRRSRQGEAGRVRRTDLLLLPHLREGVPRSQKGRGRRGDGRAGQDGDRPEAAVQRRRGAGQARPAEPPSAEHEERDAVHGDPCGAGDAAGRPGRAGPVRPRVHRTVRGRRREQRASRHVVLGSAGQEPAPRGLLQLHESGGRPAAGRRARVRRSHPARPTGRQAEVGRFRSRSKARSSTSTKSRTRRSTRSRPPSAPRRARTTRARNRARPSSSQRRTTTCRSAG